MDPAQHLGMLTRIASVLMMTALGLGVVACGPAADDAMEEEGFVLLQPKLDSIAPSAITLGDTVTVVGEDFILPKDGTLSLLLDGAYVDSDGVSHPFEGEIELNVLNPSVAEFEFEEVFFHPTRDKIGTWQGTAALVARRPTFDDLGTHDESWSLDKDVSLRVNPSVLMTRMRSADDVGCANVTSGTNSFNNIELGFRPIGLGEASPEHPWTVRVNFTAPEMNVRYVVPDAFDFWPINGPLDDNVSSPVEAEGTHRFEFTVDSGDQIVLDPTTTARYVKVSPPVTIGQEQYSEVLLGSFMAGAVEEGGKSTSTFVIEVSTDDGRTLRRLASIDIWSEVEIGNWDGEEVLVERYEPHAVSGCIPGGLIGGELKYSESESITQQRNITVQWDAAVSTSLGFKAGVSAFSVSGEQQWSRGFGVNVSDSVSSTQSSGQELAIQLLPNYFGMSYRQLERLERKVDVIYHNACGASGTVGEAYLTNWNFAFDVTQGPECAPDSNLPPAEVF